VQNFLEIGSGVPELEDPEKWHFPLKAFIALTTVLRYRADCDHDHIIIYIGAHGNEAGICTQNGVHALIALRQ